MLLADCLCALAASRASVFTLFHGLPTQVAVGTSEGLKHESAVQCDGLVSLEKSRLTDYVGELTSDKLGELDAALSRTLALLGSAGQFGTHLHLAPALHPRSWRAAMNSAPLSGRRSNEQGSGAQPKVQCS
jgi:hypothetical protein